VKLNKIDKSMPLTKESIQMYTDMITLLQQEEKLATSKPRFYYKQQYEKPRFSDALGNAHLLYFKSSLHPMRAFVGLQLLHKIIDHDDFDPKYIRLFNFTI
jgi:hypothetical protein